MCLLDAKRKKSADLDRSRQNELEDLVQPEACHRDVLHTLDARDVGKHLRSDSSSSLLS